ncbi:Ferredoxin reductase-like, C-terminal NADP-linked [Venustampulla echinocandica]|uniref:ferric-chelate reductase (NADPH) n=1 Tax=Venustampulla echinocandica TaxID=2656787 RepID=A0A370TKV7_9HELO|nr:Ferredoxin reductase-like, C-terminal NADP-linked [Venustampulla echinocandica]RDL36158.1 Ferredoxin reductase-like, C-terminal NADP-linked [Venustampulla echinocandica]
MAPNTVAPASAPKNATAAAAAAAALKKSMAARAFAQHNNEQSTKLARQILNHPAPGFKSVGHAVVVVVYIGINIVLVATNIDKSTVFGASKRLGWVSLANIAFLTFLGLKNTPLAFLTSYSYETLNPLHQIAGYTTIICALLHVIFQCVTFDGFHELEELIAPEQISGIIAAVSMLTILFVALVMKRLRYEVFYVTHVTMYMLILINVALHRPDFAKKTVIIPIVAAGMWICDRILRATRILWNSRDNRATITPLPRGGTRIVLRRSPSRAVPGTHCFLWVPKIRLFESHPFTIVSTSPTSLELVISAYDGFTHELHEYAVKHPGISLRASIDGPYGALPSFAKVADKIVLIAGGSGASFTFGVALDTIKRLEESSKTTIDFVWSVREQDTLTWFSKELNELRASPRVNVSIYSTLPAPPASTGSQTPTSRVEDEKTPDFPISAITPSSNTQDIPDTDAEKEVGSAKVKATPWDSTTSLDITTGRPDVPAIINSIVAGSSKEERIVIAACGPLGMMKDVRRSATKAITVSGPSIDLHLEQFGW